jgi:hypothetical protein
MRKEWHVACMGDVTNAYRILMGKREGMTGQFGDQEI